MAIIFCSVYSGTMVIHGQSETSQKTYYARLLRTSRYDFSESKYFIYKTMDTSVVFSTSYRGKIPHFDRFEMPYDDLDVIKIRRKGKTGRALGFGVLSGTIAGALLGMAVIDDCAFN